MSFDDLYEKLPDVPVRASKTKPTYRYYISGPITGLEGVSRKTFDDEARALRAQGFSVFNPWEIPAPPDSVPLRPKAVWQYYMNICVATLPLCDELIMLPNWQNSEGASWEHRIGEMLGKKITYRPVL